MKPEETLGVKPAGFDVLAWLQTAVEVLERGQDLVNSANVFPVPDADTGTNMLLTVKGARDGALQAAGDSETFSLVMKSSPDALQTTGESDDYLVLLNAAALGALKHARGNSGIILAEYLRGFAAGAAFNAQSANNNSAQSTGFDSQSLVNALTEASTRAFSAVAVPAEGTILTAARAAAQGAQERIDTEASADLASVLDASLEHASRALDRSYLDLEVLHSAGVLDAGAYGLVLFISALHSVVSKVPVVFRAQLGAQIPVSAVPAESESDGEFEVMCLVSAADDTISDDSAAQATSALRSALTALGKSVVVIGGLYLQGNVKSGLWSVHVHTDSPNEVISALESVTEFPVKLSQIVIRNLHHQVMLREQASAGVRLVVCVKGPELVFELSRAGAIVCIERDQALGLSDIERALTEVHTTTGLDAQGTIIVSHEENLATQILASSHGGGLVQASNDAEVVAATAFLVVNWSMGQDLTIEELVQLGNSSVANTRSELFAGLDASETERVIDLIKLEQSDDSVAAVTIVANTSAFTDVSTTLVPQLEQVFTQIEISVIPSGLAGPGFIVAVEWIDE